MVKGGASMLAIGLLLTACAAERPAQPVSVSDLHCDNGQAVRIEWWSERVVVTHVGERWTLPLAVSGSGARYSDGVREVWEHQGVVRMTDGAAPPTSCK